MEYGNLIFYSIILSPQQHQQRQLMRMKVNQRRLRRPRRHRHRRRRHQIKPVIRKAAVNVRMLTKIKATNHLESKVMAQRRTQPILAHQVRCQQMARHQIQAPVVEIINRNQPPLQRHLPHRIQTAQAL